MICCVHFIALLARTLVVCQKEKQINILSSRLFFFENLHDNFRLYYYIFDFHHMYLHPYIHRYLERKSSMESIDIHFAYLHNVLDLKVDVENQLYIHIHNLVRRVFYKEIEDHKQVVALHIGF